MRIKNGLVMVVILLFVGVAVQPGIAVNPISADNEEDCSICPKASKQHLVRLKSLLNRVETLNNKLSVVSKLNPKVAEEYQELSDIILILTQFKKEILSDSSHEYGLIKCVVMLIRVVILFCRWMINWYFLILFMDNPLISNFLLNRLLPIHNNLYGLRDELLESDCWRFIP